MTPRRSRLAEAFVLAAILMTFWWVRWPARDTVLIRDEGEYAYLGQRILRGDVPYRDVYNQKTPLAFYAVAAGQALLGPTVEELRLFGSAYGLLSTAAVYAVARSALGPLGAATAALSFVALVFDQAGVLHQASTEYFMLLWLALGVLAWTKAGDSAKGGWATAAGALAGLACLTKQSGAVLLAFFAADALYQRRREGLAALAPAARELAWALAGFAAVLVLVGVFFAAQGAFEDFVECAWFQIGGYVGERHHEVSIRDRLAWLADIVGRDAGFWLVGSFGLYRAARSTTGAASGWWLLLPPFLAAAIVPGGTFRHYYLPLVVPFALGMGALAQGKGLGVRSGRPGRVPRSEPQASEAGQARQAVRRLALALALLLPFLGPLAQAWALFFPDLSRVPPRLFRPFDRAEVVARAIAARTGPDEAILIVGSEPQIYYLADRPAATRLIHLYTTTGPYRSASALREEFMRDLERRPRYVLLVNMISSLTEFPSRLGAFLLPVVRILQADYVVEERWEGPGYDMALRGFGQAEFLLWRLRETRDAGGTSRSEPGE